MSVRVLAFDTSTELTSVAVCVGGRVLAEDESPSTLTDARHAELLLPRVRACLAAAGVELATLDLIAVGAGPGSFTGVRVGLATAKGLGWALDKPVVPVVSLEALAWQATSETDWIAPCLDAFKGELFAALYRNTEHGLEAVVPPFHATPRQTLARLHERSGKNVVALCGSGLARYPEAFAPESLAALPNAACWQRLAPAFASPRARALSELAVREYDRGALPDLAEIAPMYLRDSDAQLPKTPLRV